MEKDLEKYLKEKAEAAGGMCVKLACPGTDSMPDRLLLFPNGKMCLVELKASEDKKVKGKQLLKASEIRKMGFPVYFVKSKTDVKEILNLIMGYNYIK